MLFEKIQRLCKEAGISIAKLEREAGLGNATIRGWRTSEPQLGKIVRVAEYLGFSVDELLQDTEYSYLKNTTSIVR